MHIYNKQNLRYNTMMTNEQHQKLEKYEQIFKTAINSNYYRAMDSRFAADFVNACKELNVYLNVSCPQCVLKALQTVGKLYFDFRNPEQPASAEKSDSSEQTEKPKIAKKPVEVRSSKPKKTK